MTACFQFYVQKHVNETVQVSILIDLTETWSWFSAEGESAKHERTSPIWTLSPIEALMAGFFLFRIWTVHRTNNHYCCCQICVCLLVLRCDKLKNTPIIVDRRWGSTKERGRCFGNTSLWECLWCWLRFFMRIAVWFYILSISRWDSGRPTESRWFTGHSFPPTLSHHWILCIRGLWLTYS